MTTSTLFILVAAVVIAPHVPGSVAQHVAGVLLVLGVLASVVEKVK